MCPASQSISGSRSRLIDVYAAGLLDGEGCIYVDPKLTARIDVGMTERAKPTLEWLARTYGGRVRPFREETERWQAAWTWTVIGTKATAVCEQLLPHLQIKQEQARLVLRLAELRSEMPMTKYRRPGWTPELRERGLTIRRRVMELNRKGPLADEAWPEGAFARLVAGTWVTPQTDLFSDLGSETFSGPWPLSGYMERGAVWTQGTSECPSGGDASTSLGDVLLETVPERFFLSPRAAAGILRRAEKRRRELPRALHTALAELASQHQDDDKRTTRTSSSQPSTDSLEVPKTTAPKRTISSHQRSLGATERAPTATLPTPSSVRRLTPTECERLQSFPDRWTIPGPTDPATQHSEMP
jgi:hypothetical protein